MERFIFPKHDIAPVNTFNDNRTELEIFQDILKILGRKVKACDLSLYEQLLQRSPLTTEMSENGIRKSAAELKAEIKRFKMGNAEHELVDKLSDNLRTHVKNMQVYMVYLHNNKMVKGKPRYITKLNALKHHQKPNSREQYIDHLFQLSTSGKKNSKNSPVNRSLPHTVPSKTIKNVMLLHRQPNK